MITIPRRAYARHALFSRGRSVLEVWILGLVLALALGAVIIRILEKVLDINLTCWSLRKQGVADDEIQKVALATAKRERRHIVLQVLDRVIEFCKSRKS